MVGHLAHLLNPVLSPRSQPILARCRADERSIRIGCRSSHAFCRSAYPMAEFGFGAPTESREVIVYRVRADLVRPDRRDTVTAR